jgi:hypothetical protein
MVSLFAAAFNDGLEQGNQQVRLAPSGGFLWGMLRKASIYLIKSIVAGGDEVRPKPTRLTFYRMISVYWDFPLAKVRSKMWSK